MLLCTKLFDYFGGETHPIPSIRPLPRSHPAFLPALTVAGTRERDHGESARGLFARSDIPASTYVGDFAGLVKPQQPSDPSKFLLELHREAGAADGAAEAFDIDAQHFGNEASRPPTPYPAPCRQPAWSASATAR